MITALVLKSTGSWYVVKTTNGDIFSARVRGKLRLLEKDISNPVAVGDQVVIKMDPHYENTAQIMEVLPRKNYIIRKSNKLSSKRQILASNLDFGLLVASLKAPATSLGFIDRFLACCEAYHITGIVFFNKLDLLNSEELNRVNELKNDYEHIGYKVFVGSATDTKTILELKELILNRTTLLAGHSGVGKSTLLNNLFPIAEAKVGLISKTHEKGMHTTTFAQMYDFNSTYLIDTPGIREFGLIDIEKQELAHSFPEIRKFLKNCKFNNCLHINEPNCAVKEAVENGDINPERYISYLSMYANEDLYN